jgi:hypothetical protein
MWRVSWIHWSPDWREDVGPDEPAEFAEFAEKIAAIARDVAARTHEPVGRVFHLKKHTGVVGELRVLEDLPEPLASGVFGTHAYQTGTHAYPCYLRFSNGAVRRQLDGILDVRGIGLKLVGVEGAQLLPENAGAATQDFLFVQTPAVPTDSFDEFLALARASIGGPLLLPLKLALAVGPFATARLLLRLAMVPRPISLAGATYFNAVPIRFGRAAAKLSLVPEQEPDVREGATYRDDVVARLRRGPLRWRLRAQLYTDEARTPIESASIEWRGSFHDVAQLTLPQQDIESARGREIDALVDELSFNPWHGIEAHRPLGKTQRARADAYRASTKQRVAKPEPTSVLSPK